jgi:hypothetical protein
LVAVIRFNRLFIVLIVSIQESFLTIDGLGLLVALVVILSIILFYFFRLIARVLLVMSFIATLVIEIEFIVIWWLILTLLLLLVLYHPLLISRFFNWRGLLLDRHFKSKKLFHLVHLDVFYFFEISVAITSIYFFNFSLALYVYCIGCTKSIAHLSEKGKVLSKHFGHAWIKHFLFVSS